MNSFATSMNPLKYLLLLLIAPMALCAIAQTQEERILQEVRDLEQAKNAAIMRKLDRGIEKMELADYQQADRLFREVLAEAKVVPTELTFYFGKNSYLMEKYKQSIDWLNKYIEIKGTKGQFFEEAKGILAKANAAYLEVRSANTSEAEAILTSNNFNVDCGPSGMVICPVCQGEGVIIQNGPFGRVYKSCPYSDDYGRLSCEDYNKLLQGELQPRSIE